MNTLDLTIFSSISLSEMDKVRLMRRIDTKYVFHVSILSQLLKEAAKHYQILDIDKKRQASYETLYFDTPLFTDYHMHHNGKLNRKKIRQRKYIDSRLCFLELKYKTNKGRTEKSRIAIKDFTDTLEHFDTFFQKHHISDLSNYQPALKNTFKRITLVDTKHPQRITIDTELIVKKPYDKTGKELSGLVVAEIKQDAKSQSIFAELLKQYRIYPAGFSKYAIGISLLYDTVKYNRFKSKLLYLQKITQP